MLSTKPNLCTKLLTKLKVVQMSSGPENLLSGLLRLIIILICSIKLLLCFSVFHKAKTIYKA